MPQNLETYQVRDEIDKIAANADDPERAHAMADALHERVLRAIADGCTGDPAVLASIALDTEEIEFSRWCS